MEFEEMKSVWDTQNSRPLFVIDEIALHKRIHRKRHSVLVSISDWITIISYLGCVIFLVGRNSFKPGPNIFLYLEAAWMCAIVVYVLVSHIRRLKADRRFDRSIHGDLDHAIFLVRYQMRISQMFRWNLPPMGVIMLFCGWVSGKLLLVSAVILVSNTVAFYALSRGLRMNKKRIRGLQELKEKLENSSI